MLRAHLAFLDNVVYDVKMSVPSHDQPGCVIWLTGLSGSGKTTLAKEVCRRLAAKTPRVEHLDGDAVREVFPLIGYDRDSRNDHIRRIGFLASRLEKHGVIVVASFISPYQESRDFTRKLCRHFIEVYLNAPLAVCESRDPKGLYKKAREGKITNFTGVQEPYEPPASPELTLDTSQLTVDRCVDLILDNSGAGLRRS